MAVVSKLSPDGSLATNSFDEYSMAASNYGVTFNGSSQYLTAPYNATFNFSTNDFTIETWVYPTSYADNRHIAGLAVGTNNTRSWYFALSITTGLPYFYWYVDGVTGIVLTGSAAPSLNTWSHIAITRTSGTTRMFLNGAQIATLSTQNGAMYNNASAVPTIGREAAFNGSYFIGNISNFRIVNGTSLYTAAFTPPTSPLTNITNTSLLTCQSSTIIDNSTNAFTITNNGTATILSNALTLKTVKKQYSNGIFQTLGDIDEYTLAASKNYVVFNGSSQYLIAPSSSVSGIGTGNFTIEGWFYNLDFTIRTTYYQRLWSFGNGLANDVTLNVDTSGFIVYRNNDTVLITSSSAVSLNAWYHLAIVRNGTTTTMYLNGVSVGSTSTSNNLTSPGGYSIYIGNESGATRGGYFYGYISNFRIISGTSIYTAAFTPPAGPLLPITNTSLLTCQNPTIIDNSINNFAITTAGSPLSTSILNLYTANFSGASQYLRVPYSAAFDFSASTWTLECWFKANAFDLVILSKDTYGTNFDFCMYVSATTIFSQTAGTAQSYSVTTGITLAVGTWHHLAMVRSAGTLNYYLDGVKYGAGSTMGITNASQSYVTLGCFSWNNPSGYMNGSVSNLRMVQGTALYTANFTPSQTNLTAISGTSFLTYQSPTIVDNSTNAITISNFNSVTVTPPIFPQTLAATQSSDGVYRIAGNLDEITGFTVPISYLAIAGGGNGGTSWGGGGGGGGMIESTVNLNISSVYTIVIGAGGGTISSGASRNYGISGSNTTITGTDVSITAYGGGAGGVYTTAGGNGGSGGGGAGSNNGAGGSAAGIGVYPGSTYISATRQGYDGARPGVAGGGGGGAGAAGSGSNGGAGLASSITGASITYAGGGGGYNTGSGGSGGGGGVATSGTANLGGGGGSDDGTNIGLGGSGVVILSVPTAKYTGIITGSPVVTTSGTNTILKYNSSGTYTA